MTKAQVSTDDLKAVFFSVFGNIPIDLRKTVIFIVDDQPISWNVAYLEILTKSERSTAILEGLRRLKLI